MLNPDTAIGTVLLNISATIGSLALVALFSWFIGPLKWLVQNRRIRKIILGDREFRLVFNPSENKSKIVTFLPNGDIGQGRNNNEHTWHISKGKLEIIEVDSKVYSRFKFDAEQGKFIHTNDINTRSIHGQFIIPLWERAATQES